MNALGTWKTRGLCAAGGVLLCLLTVSVPAVSSAAQSDESDGCPRGAYLTAEPQITQSVPSGMVVSVGSTYYVCFDPQKGEVVKAIGQVTPKKQKPPEPTDCTLAWNNWNPIFNPVCWVRMGTAAFSSVLIWATAWLLAAAGFVFNTLTDFTILNFGKFYGMIHLGVEAGWKAFRDIVNIVIIGMFTFIAISIILGVERYGQKKLIARVLIIAVLLNFSLLFTKLIIDASNFTAAQLYSAMPLPSQAAAAADVSQGWRYEGIAGSFVNLIGMSSFADSYDLLRKAQEKTNSFLPSVVHGLGSAILLFGAAAVLLYGCYIIATRAILLVFLLLTSPIAFASYLIPGTEDRSMGWRTWWMSLASAAILAPLLMSLLWVTLRIGRELKTGLEGDGQYGTIGGFFANPVNVGNLDAIFMYILMVGLLYKCFQLTRDFSTNITRFNLTGGFLKGPFGTALGLGFLGGAKATQGSVGWGAAAGLRAIRRSGWTSKGGLRGMVARRTATALNSMRKASFNPLRTDLGAKAAKAVGVPGMFLDKKISEGGFAGAMGRKAKAADELARQIGPTQGQREEVRGQAEAQMREHRRIARENMEGIIRGQQRTLATLMERERPQAEERARQSQADRPRVEAAIRQQQEELTRVATQRESARNRQESEMRATERIIDAAQRGAEQRRLENVHTGELTQFSERERQARETLALNQGLLGRLDAVAERLTNEQLAEHEEIAPLRRSIEQNTAQLREHDQQNEGKIREAGREAERQGDLTLRSALLWDKRAIPDIEDEMRAHGRRQQWADFRALHREDERADRPAGGTPPAAPAGGGH